jgi:enoyl-CoA hydratase
LELALSCDLIVASERATFADTHAQIGLLPAWGMSALLPRAVGMRKAVELTITGAFIDAHEALRLGLVNSVVPHAELRERVLELAKRIGTCDPATVQATLQLYRQGDGLPIDAALALESETWQRWRASPKDRT